MALDINFSSAGRNAQLAPSAISYLSYGKLRFIINDCPSDNNIGEYIKEFKKNNVSDVVRVCERSYSSAPLDKEGISLHDLAFEDGGTPPAQVIKRWLELCRLRFGSFKSTSKTTSDEEEVRRNSTDNLKGINPDSPPCIAVHCVAGLGRAPVLVAIALIEYGVDKLDAIDFIRKRRRGAFNSRQIQYIDSYKRQNAPANRMMSKFSKMFRFSSQKDQIAESGGGKKH
ncbi:hypothetical protein MIR68_004758 [Amoeboaphelidium protococcarum]|nr:hypothetical protein MIR68_004758 [Amoeboaphelidium protococcarum]KAI3647755.1 hypothetical protein MP228_007976 [Amoeboaphelidium protococcarum]